MDLPIRSHVGREWLSNDNVVERDAGVGVNLEHGRRRPPSARGEQQGLRILS